MNSKTVIDKIEELNTQLCVGSDPNKGSIEERIKRTHNLIKETYEYAVAFKLNRQFFLGATLEQIQSITRLIHEFDRIAIIDHKLSDIGSSNEAALTSVKKEGFDLITVSGYPGNLQQSFEYGQSLGIGIIALLFMSNPEFQYQFNPNYPIYRYFLESCSKFADGVVIGTTNFITEDILNEAQGKLDNQFVLAPGLGAQGGAPSLLAKIFGSRVMYSVTRAIQNSNDPGKAAKMYKEEINLSKKS